MHCMLSGVHVSSTASQVCRTPVQPIVDQTVTMVYVVAGAAVVVAATVVVVVVVWPVTQAAKRPAMMNRGLIA